MTGQQRFGVSIFRFLTKKLFLGSLLCLVLGAAYYFYLHSLYIVDETLEIPRRPFNTNQFLTIRVGCIYDDSCETLSAFLAHYSSCPVTQEIQVFGTNSKLKTKQSYSKISYFSYPTDSHGYQAFVDESNNVGSEAVAFLQSAQKIACEDLEFAFSVWKSSPKSVVGLYPRLSIPVENNKYKYLGPFHVWWHGGYSLMLSKGLIYHKNMLWRTQSSSLAPVDLKFREQLEKNNACRIVALHLHSRVLGLSGAPIWVDVPVKSFSFWQKIDLSVDKDCIDRLLDGQQSIGFPVSIHKSVWAKNRWSW